MGEPSVQDDVKSATVGQRNDWTWFTGCFLGGCVYWVLARREARPVVAPAIA
jgi:cytosine/uracil/thiamine/allantoin permease